MANTFLLGALIGRINLAKQHKKESIIEKKSPIADKILKILFKENIIRNYIETQNNFIIFLKNTRERTSLIKQIKILSRPGKKIYVNVYQLSSLYYQNKLSFYILSTPKGILRAQDALDLNTGGELLFKVTF